MAQNLGKFVGEIIRVEPPAMDEMRATQSKVSTAESKAAARMGAREHSACSGILPVFTHDPEGTNYLNLRTQSGSMPQVGRSRHGRAQMSEWARR
jgi:hypothetical protein